MNVRTKANNNVPIQITRVVGRRARKLLGDGAMGTMLQQAGLTDGGAPELWNVTAPEQVCDLSSLL
ncbi:MAG: hypothetical protein R2932_09770 [Caldilineaceae bacterium]